MKCSGYFKVEFVGCADVARINLNLLCSAYSHTLYGNEFTFDVGGSTTVNAQGHNFLLQANAKGANERSQFGGTSFGKIGRR